MGVARSGEHCYKLAGFMVYLVLCLFNLYCGGFILFCNVCVGVCMCGFCNVWECVCVCVCVGFVMCGCVCVYVGFVMCGCVYVWVL